ncbi:unnamed protein product [Moneuplotes crassus]|uniref:Uncharacterized protein n=1 Tax=Euplotes crassus TaxID=5936 RepID=A0AAD1XFH3_EUPCR|nr:unnamed protein product [Moneuplotes crassus]
MPCNLFFGDQPDQKPLTSAYNQRREKIKNYLSNLRTQTKTKNMSHFVAPKVKEHKRFLKNMAFLSKNRYSGSVNVDYNDQDSPDLTYNKFTDMRCLRQRRKKSKMRISLKTSHRKYSPSGNKNLINSMKELYTSVREPKMKSNQKILNKTSSGSRGVFSNSKIDADLIGDLALKRKPMKSRKLHRSVHIKKGSKNAWKFSSLSNKTAYSKKFQRTPQTGKILEILRYKPKDSFPRVSANSKFFKSQKDALKQSLMGNYATRLNFPY